MQSLTGYSLWNSRDISEDVLILTSVGLAAIGYAFSQRFTGKKVSGLAEAAKFFAILGSFLILISNLAQGFLESSAIRALTDTGTLANPAFGSALFTGNIAEPDASVTLKYLLGWRGIYFVGFVSLFVSSLIHALALFSVWRGKGESYQEVDLHLTEKEIQEAY